MIAAIALGLLTVSLVVVLARALIGPTVQDRILSANTFGTTTVLWLCVFAAAGGRDHVIDIATIYALTSFVATIAMLRFVEGIREAKRNGEEDSGREGGP